MLTPQIENSLKPTTQIVLVPSKTYKMKEERIAGYVDGLEAVKQAIYHTLMVERYSCLIYDDNYGVELEQYIGQDIEFLKATIESTLKEALTQDLRIKDVIVTNIKELENIILVKFTVKSTYGDIQMEVNINV